MTTTQAQQIRTFADAEKVLAQRLPGYTERPQQQAMAAFVEEVIATGGHGLAEAGCGTGKSLGTVIPAILSGKRTVIATATIALMEQYANKDVPFLEANLGVEFTWALLKGRSNYFCRAKASDANPAYVPLAALNAELDANPEHTGDREHFETPVTKEEFSHVSISAADCPGKRDCPFGEICFAEAAKQKAKESQIVITNTAMLMTDLKVREMTDGYASMLSDYDLVLIDEGHETEEIATNALQSEIRPNGITKMIGESMTLAKEQGVTLTEPGNLSAALTVAWRVLEEREAAKSKKDRNETDRLTLTFWMEHAEEFLGLIESLKAFADEVSTVSINRGGERSEAKRNRIVKRAKNYIDTIGLAISTDDEMLVRWTEKVEMRRGEDQVVLATAPVHVGSYLAQWLWDRVPAVLISATLSVNGDFSYIMDRLGLPAETQALNVGTPFDYSTQAMLFVPKDGTPWPSKQKAAWMSYAQMTMADLVRASKGGALLLFTSREAMNGAYDNLRQMLAGEGINFYRQGDDSNKVLAQKFSEDTHSVLFALKSFFTGVDFQGDTCRLVVIDKMPFPVPTEPVFAARADQIERFGGSSFQDLTIPMMTLTLQQGYGRAIRTVEDRAVIAILDPRLTTSWGGKIVRGLPASPKTSDMADVRAFYA